MIISFTKALGRRPEFLSNWLLHLETVLSLLDMLWHCSCLRHIHFCPLSVPQLLSHNQQRTISWDSFLYTYRTRWGCGTSQFFGEVHCYFSNVLSALVLMLCRTGGPSQFLIDPHVPLVPDCIIGHVYC